MPLSTSQAALQVPPLGLSFTKLMKIVIKMKQSMKLMLSQELAKDVAAHMQ
jgi:hypothetical protein